MQGRNSDAEDGLAGTAEGVVESREDGSDACAPRVSSQWEAAVQHREEARWEGGREAPGGGEVHSAVQQKLSATLKSNYTPIKN